MAHSSSQMQDWPLTSSPLSWGLLRNCLCLLRKASEVLGFETLKLVSTLWLACNQDRRRSVSFHQRIQRRHSGRPCTHPTTLKANQQQTKMPLLTTPATLTRNQTKTARKARAQRTSVGWWVRIQSSRKLWLTPSSTWSHLMLFLVWLHSTTVQRSRRLFSRVESQLLTSTTEKLTQIKKLTWPEPELSSREFSDLSKLTGEQTSFHCANSGSSSKKWINSLIAHISSRIQSIKSINWKITCNSSRISQRKKIK